MAGPARPTPEQAKQTAEAWLAVASFGGDPGVTKAEGKAILALTRLPMFVVAFDPEGGCKATTVRSPFATSATLACLRKYARGSDVEAWDKQSGKQLVGPLRAYRGKLAILEKAATLVHHHEECAGQGNDLVMAVAFDKETPKVVAFYWQMVFCGE